MREGHLKKHAAHKIERDIGAIVIFSTGLLSWLRALNIVVALPESWSLYIKSHPSRTPGVSGRKRVLLFSPLLVNDIWQLVLKTR